MANKKGKSIAITSAKGGVGKTITALNLAGLYEVIGKKVLIIDLDLYGGGIAVCLNKEVNKNIYHFVEDLANKRYEKFTDYVTSYDQSIDFLASPKDPRQASKIDPYFVNSIIDKALFLYDVVLIDMNHILNDLNIITLDRVDKILLLFENDPMDLKNLRSLLTILKDLEFNNYKILLNCSRDPFKKYFSLYDMKSILNNNIDYGLSEYFFIKDIDKYLMKGQIISLYPKASSVFAKDYTALMNIAVDLLKEVDKNEEI